MEQVTWSIKRDDYYADGAIAIFERCGIPVLVQKAGTYPLAVDSAGRTTRDIPHIVISLAGARINGVEYFRGVSVYAIGTRHRGASRQLEVFTDTMLQQEQGETTPSKWVEIGCMKIDDAISVLESLDSQYEAAGVIIDRALKYLQPLTRSEYEAACLNCEVDALADSDCLCYGVRYGNFTYPNYEAKHVAQMHLARGRMMQLEAEQVAAKRAKILELPKLTQQGQLWEPCEQCGAEPVYMPLNLCNRCWPK